MSMTREEAIERHEGIRYTVACFTGSEKDCDAVDMAFSALRPVGREQVEKVWRGEWKCHGDCGVTECSACGWNIEEYVGNYNFCPSCGAPMTDKAVQMVMERLEEMYK